MLQRRICRHVFDHGPETVCVEDVRKAALGGEPPLAETDRSDFAFQMPALRHGFSSVANTRQQSLLGEAYATQTCREVEQRGSSFQFGYQRDEGHWQAVDIA